MQNFSIFPREMAASLWRNRSLIIALVKREVVGRYRGSIMGIAWSFFNPLLMLVIYTFVFSVVFKARWGVGGEESKTDFAIILFVGLIVHGLFAECVNRAPAIDTLQRQLRKESNFPPGNPSLGRFRLGAVPHRHQPWRAAGCATDPESSNAVDSDSFPFCPASACFYGDGFCMVSCRFWRICA